ncbi:MAG: type I DNA topoisomerase [Sedimentisphaerales bacterium]|nr:type I DNA topoisomerase [Sedimentisphaerales bacterium]MBN2843020.1 type I DNA topoisomerase [Sedimentisphaerales bacterium]
MAKAATGKNLVIVESPAKAKTINKYLGNNFKVIASMGHVRDLPNNDMAVDIENNFSPTYETIPTRKKILSELKKLAKEAPMVYLASDLDREGEAIAWHLSEALGIKSDRFCRVVFNAITKSAIEQAFANPHSLDMDKVNAQQARRILDRIVGYQISPLLWKKVARGLSAGRVQSVAVKLVVQREKEIKAFVPEEYWKIDGIFCNKNTPNLPEKYKEFVNANTENDKGPTIKQRGEWLYDHSCLETHLVSVGGNPFKAGNQAEADKVYNAITNNEFSVCSIDTRSSNSRPQAPFITSTLQQQSANKLGYSAKNTMRLAQELYEGIDISGLGSIGLITYMRTDSTNISNEALGMVRDFISSNYGEKYLPAKANYYGSSNKAAQEAHEAIRPTDVSITPENVKNDLTPQQYKLYDLIWKRFVSCQMTPAIWDVTTVNIETKGQIDGQEQSVLFRANGRKLVFDGFMLVSGITVSGSDQILPDLSVGGKVWPVTIDHTQHFTSPPARYTEASLIKMLEAEGIGRPSTYASIISTIQDRGYVEQLDKKFFATDLGIVVTEKLNEHFTQIMDVAFTRFMEGQLDKIEEQHLDWVNVLREFYGPFKENLDRAHEEMVHARAETQPSDYMCPECGKPMVYRFGKNGRFLSCGDYPTCKYAAPCDRDGKIAQPEETQHSCPNCGKSMILRKARFGTFLGCSGYPECKTTQKVDKDGNVQPPKAPARPSGIKCHKCKDGELVIRDSKRGEFMGCNKFPKCRSIISIKMLDELTALQAEGKWPPATLEEADVILGRKTKKTATDEQDSEDTKTTKKNVAKKTVKKVAKKVAKKTTKKKTADDEAEVTVDDVDVPF